MYLYPYIHPSTQQCIFKKNFVFVSAEITMVGDSRKLFIQFSLLRFEMKIFRFICAVPGIDLFKPYAAQKLLSCELFVKLKRHEFFYLEAHSNCSELFCLLYNCDHGLTCPTLAKKLVIQDEKIGNC